MKAIPKLPNLGHLMILPVILWVIFGDPVQVTGRQASGERIAGNSKEATLLLKVGGVPFELVRIPAGEFLMGSGTGGGDEKPVHRVRIDKSFYMGRTEVTVRQFQAFVEAAGYKTEGEKGNWASTYAPAGFPIVPGHARHRLQPGFQQTQDDPAVCISFNDAVAFCKWLSQETGKNCRLPSEAEWEYACRAGGSQNSPQNFDEVGWHRDNSAGKTHPVGQKKPNALGLYDMHGNVWEWCLDMWHSGYEAAPTDGSPWTEAKFFEPVMRGGTFINPQWWLRSANHMRNNPGNRFSYNQGIRIVRTR